MNIADTAIKDYTVTAGIELEHWQEGRAVLHAPVPAQGMRTLLAWFIGSRCASHRGLELEEWIKQYATCVVTCGSPLC